MSVNFVSWDLIKLLSYIKSCGFSFRRFLGIFLIDSQTMLFENRDSCFSFFLICTPFISSSFFLVLLCHKRSQRWIDSKKWSYVEKNSPQPECVGHFRRWEALVKTLHRQSVDHLKRWGRVRGLQNIVWLIFMGWLIS